jgi:predicted RNA-binding Zn-ribbon protein involved in translation (DUF1610 family)
MDLRFKNLERFKVGGTRDQMKLALPLPQSPRGMVYRYCPEESCAPRLFLLGQAPEEQTISPEGKRTVRRQPHTPGMTCPYCGHDAPDDEFLYPGDIEAAKEFVAWAAKTDIADYLGNAFKQMTQNVNRQGGLVTMRYEEGSRELAPRAWREDLLRNLICDTCQREYGVYAIGFFCPDCGASNLRVHFQREIDLTTKQVSAAQAIQDDPEFSYRLLGNAHEDVLTALESYLKTIFRYVVKKRLPDKYEDLCSKKAIGTSFQNVARGREQFAKVGIDPYGNLREEELEVLRLNIEKRHVIGHNLGVVDENYAKNAENEKPGQTVQLLAADITTFAGICERVVQHLAEQCPELQNTTLGNSLNRS